MRLSAIICTHNRCNLLKKAILSLKDQTAAQDNYEIIVIDNASGDGTGALVKNIQNKVPNLRYVYESELGLSSARNRGAKEARGEIVAYLDDDAIAEPDWVDVLIYTFGHIEPQPVCVGGQIRPIWEIPKPDWMPDDSRLGTFGVLQEEQAKWIYWGKTPHLLSGGNIAFIKPKLLDLGGFNASLGRKGNMLLSNEESLLLYLISRSFGEKSLYYQPKLIVKHLLPSYKISKQYIYKHYYWAGVSTAIMSGIIAQISSDKRQPLLVQGKNKFGLIADIMKRLAYICLKALKAIFSLNKRKRTEYCLSITLNLGYILGLIKHSAAKSKPAPDCL